MKNLFLTITFVCISILGVSQTTNISGVINAYTSVSGIAGDTITVASSAGFSAGDKLIIIQMQGVTIDESNSVNFGNIMSTGNAGNYEFSTVCSILNATTIVGSEIQRMYDPSGVVQIVRVPVYNDAVITGTLTAPAWDGLTGGILAFECTGTLTMNDEIDLQGIGFRGGTVTTSTYACEWFTNVTAYFYDISNGKGAMKGEGVGLYISGKTAGRGAQANGGGGGNDYNTGGGGGGNASDGGLGGERIISGTFSCQGTSPGIGGQLNTYSTALNKIFLGGGGGSGHEYNAATATAGNNGGGIVIIKAGTIIGNGNAINVEGASVLANSAEGAGGGGAGGTVLLDVSAYTGSLIVNATGGNGGNVSNIGATCNGPGGGGSGGVLWVNQSSVPSAITINNNGGASGTTIATMQGNCSINGSNNATPGNAGITVTDLSLVESICNISMPISLMLFDAVCKDKKTMITWTTASEINSDFFTIERSIDRVDWEQVIKIDGAGNSSSSLDYIWQDENPFLGVSYYRLKQTDFNGQYFYSNVVATECNSSNTIVSVYPNPAVNQITITGLESELKHLRIHNVLGQDVTNQTRQISSTESIIVIDLANLSTGLYHIKTKTTANKIYKQ